MDNLSDDIIKYKKGELSPVQMHALEKKALANPFLAEALEGVENISSEELTADISSIEKGIRSKKKTMFAPLRIAAGIVFIVASVFLVYQFIPKPETVALKTEKRKPGNKKEEAEKQSAGSGQGMEKGKIERKKSGVESKEKRKVEPQTSSNQNPAARVQEQELNNQYAAKIQQPIEQAPVQDLAVTEGEPVKTENADDQKAKEIGGPEQKAAGIKGISHDKKKESFAASEVQRAAPSAKMSLTKSISGQVISMEDGSPLPGVNVILKGTTIGTVTNANGNYTIPADLDTQSLVFTFIGLQAQEVDASGRDRVDVQMKEDVSQLSEVVVTGIGIAKDDDAEPVMKWAEPDGGRKAYDHYLESNVSYPEEALKNKIKGKAGIEFTVGTDGSLSDFRVIKKLGYGCEDEIIRLVKEGPKWNPTTEDNKPIESTVRVRLRFDPAKTGR